MYGYFLALGSNVGDRKKHFEDALNRLSPYGTTLFLTSTICSKPLSHPTITTKFHEDYSNCMIAFASHLNASCLYKKVVEIEDNIGHPRQMRWQPREIDIDFIRYFEIQENVWQEKIYKDGSFLVPHLSFKQRSFLVQLDEELCSIFGSYTEHTMNHLKPESLKHENLKTTHYFSPGPAVLPDAVRHVVQEELLDTFGIGVSILEISHRSKQYADVNEQALALARSVFQVPSTHEVIFTPFGAQQHFSLIIQHLSLPNDTISYTDTGVWAHMACAEAKNSGREVEIIFNGAPAYNSLGDFSNWKVSSKSKYLHITVNNTVYGTEYKQIPSGFGVNLVLDMTSSIASRQDIPWPETAVVYASAQKNFGIAGCSVVIIRKDILLEMRTIAKQNKLGNALCYPAFFDAKSILNTPPCFSVYVASKFLEWIHLVGGVPTMEAWATEKSEDVYSELDSGFYIPRVPKEYRSRHNFVFSLPTEELNQLFIQEAEQQGILEVKGYRTTGGIRASMYNGVSVESAKYFVKFLKVFKQKYAQ
jgi:phosphoserine aminotransferase